MYGNNGSVDGDLVVVMCYMEVCLLLIVFELLCDFDKEIVEFVLNFDDMSEELVVLLVVFLNLLVNGFIGIFVGYVIEIFLYYFGEVIDVIMMCIDKLNSIVDDLLIVMKGLDFLIGGII